MTTIPTIQTDIIAAEAVDFDGNGFFEVCAETADGQRFVLGNFGSRDSDRVDAMARRVAERGWINEAYWVESWPAYGSDAYLLQEAEAWLFGEQIRRGMATEADAPEHIRTML